MKKIFLSVILSASAGLCLAQQDPQFTQNTFLMLPVNPGYAGTKGSVCATTAYRNQWLSFPGQPKTFLFTVDMPVEELGGGAGITVVKDKLGNFNFTMIRAAYSFHRVVNRGAGLLGLGVEAGTLRSFVDNNWLAPDGTNGLGDLAIPSAAVKGGTYDIGAGAYYTSRKLNIGFSLSHVPGKAEQIKATKFGYQVARHYYLMAEYRSYLSPELILQPSVFVKSDGAVATFDLHCDLFYDQFIWGGLTYRLQDAISPSAGFAFRVNKTSMLKIGYSYDLGASDLRSYHNNTHELVVNYCIKWNREPDESHVNPKWMITR